MTFYSAMQLGASSLKPIIKGEENKKTKAKYILAFILKDILCLAFCMAVTIMFSMVFGNDNSIVGVVTVMAILTFRFSHFDFNTKQSALALFGVFVIYTIFPVLASTVSPLPRFFINLIAILTIVMISCHDTTLANQSILVLSYLLLFGYEVDSINLFVSRTIALLFGGFIVSAIFYLKQKDVVHVHHFKDVLKDIHLDNERTRWQINLALTISTGILIGDMFHFPRTMWIGFACMSIVHPNKEKVSIRTKERMLFAVVGCLIFLMIPSDFFIPVGIIGGIMVGFSGSYKWQTAFNSFGALASAIPLLGVTGAIIFRLIANILGPLYAKHFSKVIDKFIFKEEKLA